MDVRFQRAGRAIGGVIVCVKPVCQYVFYFLMIAYECYDCVSDGMNVYQYSRGDSLDALSSRNENVYRAFVFSLIVSVLCALAGSVGYILLIVGLSKTLHDHQTERNNTTKLGKLIIFVSLFCQVCFEETIQSIVLYYYIVRCSVLFSFWKISLFVCISLSLLLAGSTFFKGAYILVKKRDSLRRKYPLCLSRCYKSSSLIVFVPLFAFGTILSLALFALNITTLVDMIRNSEVDIPHVLALNHHGPSPGYLKILPVKDLVESSGTLVKKLPCSMQGNFLGEPESLNCSSAIFTLSFVKETKQLQYNLHYCYHENHICNQINETNVTLKLSHDLCSEIYPVLVT